MSDSIMLAAILDSLNRAAAAHGLHEEETGEHDVEWPQWYAEHMVRTLRENGYELVGASQR
jgi:hypothetical protein